MRPCHGYWLTAGSQRSPLYSLYPEQWGLQNTEQECSVNKAILRERMEAWGRVNWTGKVMETTLGGCGSATGVR